MKVLEVNGEDKEFMLKQALILFMTDRTHQVKPVTSGARIVLQYDVYLEDSNESKKRQYTEVFEEYEPYGNYERQPTQVITKEVPQGIRTPQIPMPSDSDKWRFKFTT
jgi:hypothetical protein